MKDLRADSQAIFKTALDAANPSLAVQRVMQIQNECLLINGQKHDLANINRFFVIGCGKAGAAMAQAAEKILGDRLESGWVTVKYEHVLPLQRVKLHEAGHPLLDENSLLGTQKILSVIDQAGPDDLIICLISGGGSALLELPAEGISLADLRATNEALLRSGATIVEMNTLRKHLSQVKGGQLARRAQHTHLVTLILSDVIGSPLDVIASGPTVPDQSTFADAWRVIEQRCLAEVLHPSVVQHVLKGLRGDLPDTPKAGDPAFSAVKNCIIADNAIACQAAAEKAAALGYHPLLLTTFLQGEAREVAHVLTAISREIQQTGHPVERPACILTGGETTVTLRGQGRGGRNQELALAAALDLAGQAGAGLLSGGTDGTDGPTDAAGAFADGSTLVRAQAAGLDAFNALANNDSYPFFSALGDLILTGPTHTNVNDLQILLVE